MATFVAGTFCSIAELLRPRFYSTAEFLWPRLFRALPNFYGRALCMFFEKLSLAIAHGQDRALEVFELVSDFTFSSCLAATGVFPLPTGFPLSFTLSRAGCIEVLKGAAHSCTASLGRSALFKWSHVWNLSPTVQNVCLLTAKINPRLEIGSTLQVLGPQEVGP
eukprot:s5689_g3.t1